MDGGGTTWPKSFHFSRPPLGMSEPVKTVTVFLFMSAVTVLNLQQRAISAYPLVV